MLLTALIDRSPLIVAARTPVQEVRRALGAGHLHALVFDEERLVGVVCPCDLRDSDPGEPVSAFMSAPPTTVGPDATVTRALHLMKRDQISFLPVISRGFLAGTVTRSALGGKPC